MSGLKKNVIVHARKREPVGVTLPPSLTWLSEVELIHLPVYHYSSNASTDMHWSHSLERVCVLGKSTLRPTSGKNVLMHV